MKKLIIVYVVLIVAVILLAVFKAGGKIPSFSFFQKSEASVNGKTLNLQLAKSDSERKKGLSGKKGLGDNEGMLFVFPNKGNYPFWMRDMLFPIDIIWIDHETVVYVQENASIPGQAQFLTIYDPHEQANRVLEINAGLAKKLDIKKGTKITFKNVN